MELDRSSYSLRSTAERQVDSMESNDTMIVFNDVEFISRAFADEILTLAFTNNFTIDAESASEDVQKMLVLVSKSRTSEDYGTPNLTGIPESVFEEIQSTVDNS